MNIRNCAPTDAEAICAIYNHYVLNTIITFEEVAVDAATMRQRIDHYTQRWPWYVCEVDAAVKAYAYATQWKERAAYRHSVEVSVYVDKDCAGRGYGRALYEHLIAALLQRDCHAMIGGIALPNAASIALHEACGFRKVAHFPEVGFKFGRSIDVGYWQLTADRTSSGN